MALLKGTRNGVFPNKASKRAGKGAAKTWLWVPGFPASVALSRTSSAARSADPL